MKIYLVELEQGQHDDYYVDTVKAFEDKTEAEKFIEIRNKDMVILLEKLRIFQEKQQKEFEALRIKFGWEKMIDEPEYIDWSGKQGEEEQEIYKSFIHEKFDYICSPAEYRITEIELIKGNKKT